MKRSDAIKLVAAPWLFGAMMAAGLAHTGPASAQITQGIHDGEASITEDSPAWSCVDDGNRICGPGNGQAPAGCYDIGGVMVAAWPCYVQIDPQTGDSDVYTPDDRPGHPSSVY